MAGMHCVEPVRLFGAGSWVAEGSSQGVRGKRRRGGRCPAWAGVHDEDPRGSRHADIHLEKGSNWIAFPECRLLRFQPDIQAPTLAPGRYRISVAGVSTVVTIAPPPKRFQRGIYDSVGRTAMDCASQAGRRAAPCRAPRGRDIRAGGARSGRPTRRATRSVGSQEARIGHSKARFRLR